MYRPPFTNAVPRNSPPQQMQHIRRPEIPMNTRSSQLNNLSPHRLIRPKAELLLAVIPEEPSRNIAHLHPVSPNNRACPSILHNHVIAYIIKVVFVVSIGIRTTPTPHSSPG